MTALWTSEESALARWLVQMARVWVALETRHTRDPSGRDAEWVAIRRLVLARVPTERRATVKVQLARFHAVAVFEPAAVRSWTRGYDPRNGRTRSFRGLYEECVVRRAVPYGSTTGSRSPKMAPGLVSKPSSQPQCAHCASNAPVGARMSAIIRRAESNDQIVTSLVACVGTARAAAIGAKLVGPRRKNSSREVQRPKRGVRRKKRSKVGRGRRVNAGNAGRAKDALKPPKAQAHSLTRGEGLSASTL